jgi:hypothetical protein
MIEISKPESLGGTNSFELVIQGVWNSDGMMTGRRKTFPVL